MKVFILLCLTLIGLALADQQKVYKMCVPHKFYNDCVKILKEPSQAGTLMECVSARDRMECLEKVNKREADVIAVEPEDMYVAYHMNNQDFEVISEIRTQVEKDAEFRYEGVILVKKNSDIHSLDDLKGKKSCHTGFGRNVGYKIPITKLKNRGVLKVSMDPELAPTERELKALSEFFSQSCLVGRYSPHSETDQAWKKRYSNLCALCEHPEQCNYPDRFSGYDGAIRCLDQGQGDVAFTKTSFIKKYFGIWGNNPESTKPEDFEYLCEDGSRRPITGPACSWAQRPWKGYMSNTDAVQGDALHRLQNRIDLFFQNGLQETDKQAASNLHIDADTVLHEKPAAVKPREYLERAGYKDVIERDGSTAQKVRLCVTTAVELEKCNVMEMAAYSRDIRPAFECVMHSREDCLRAVKENQADAVVLVGEEYKLSRDYSLTPVVFESFGEDNVYVAVIDSNANSEMVHKTPIKYDQQNKRARYAAYLLNHKRGRTTCDENSDAGQIEIVNSKDLDKYQNKKLVCLDMEMKPTTEYKTCNVEALLPNAIFVRDAMSSLERQNIIHAFISLSDKFSPKGKIEDVFELFGEFKPDNRNVIFNDDAVQLVTEFTPFNGVDENTFADLHCN